MINVIDALFSLKAGKSSDDSDISAEHFLNAPLNFLHRLVSLFNQMLKHSFVPCQFRYGHMVPIVKDQQGNFSDMGNYRGITISPIASKIFEYVMKDIFSEFMLTSPSQFGFKKGNSTVHALHCLKGTIDYYVQHGSRVFCAFLDASKAFDRVVHAGLFIKLIQRNVPMVFLDVIISWYDGLFCKVKWGDQFSDWFAVTAGVRQGGILSPTFYCIYVDDLVQILKASNIGCYYLDLFAAAIFYADDMAILAPSIRGISLILSLCGEYCSEWDINLNAKKSRVMYFGKRMNCTPDITLSGDCMNCTPDITLSGGKIDWTNEWVYLGVILKTGVSFNCSITEKVRKFYRSTNAIFRIEGRSNDTVMLQLIETHCIPILTYAIEVIHVANRDERRQLRVAYNSVYRKIFNYRWSESVTALQAFLNRPTWEQLVDSRKQSFHSRVSSHGDQNLAYVLFL